MTDKIKQDSVNDRRGPMHLSRRRVLTATGTGALMSALQVRLASADTAASDVADLSWIVTGTGDNILFVHGAGGNSAVWYQQIATFKESFRTIAYDLRGYGTSQDVVDGFSPADLAEDAVAVMDVASADRAVLVCQSLGGWTGVRTALEKPERVRALVLANTMAGVMYPPALQALGSALAASGGNPANIALRPSYMEAHPEMARLYQSISAGNPPPNQNVAKAFLSLPGLVEMERLSDITVPVLMIAGENDPIWPPASLEGIAAAIPDCRLVVIAGANHSPYFETPDTFNALVRDFVDGLS